MITRESPRASVLRCLSVLAGATVGVGYVLRLLAPDLRAVAAMPGRLRDSVGAAGMTFTEVLVPCAAVVLTIALVWFWLATLATCAEAATLVRIPTGSARLRSVVLLACGLTLAAGMAPASATTGSTTSDPGKRDVLAGLPLPDRAHTPEVVGGGAAITTAPAPHPSGVGQPDQGSVGEEGTAVDPERMDPEHIDPEHIDPGRIDPQVGPAGPEPAAPRPAAPESASSEPTAPVPGETGPEGILPTEDPTDAARPPATLESSPGNDTDAGVGTPDGSSLAELRVSGAPSSAAGRDSSGHDGDIGVPRVRDTSTVTVRPGDTLWALAADELAPNASDAEINRRWQQIWERNLAAIGADPDRILPGTPLNLTTPSPSQEK